MKKYDINKFHLENRIFNEVLEYRWRCNTKELHERIVNLLSEELSEYVKADEIFNELIASGAFKKLKISKETLKKIAVDNLIIRIVEINKRFINISWNLMPLATINLENIKEEDYFTILEQLNPQLTSIMKTPVHKEAIAVVEAALKDGEIFASLIEGEESFVKEEIESEEPSKDFIKDCKKNIAMYKTYKEGKVQKSLINSIAKKITEKKLSYLLTHNVEDNSTLRQDIDKASESIELYMNDVEEVIYSKNYKRVLREVPDEELIELIQNSSSLSYKKTPSNDSVQTRKNI